jgi:N-acetylmuramoyl-L-alanine amidase
MAKPTYEFIQSPNKAPRSKPISAIVVHYTGSMNIDGTISWFRRSDSKVSAHYVVGRDGRVVQMVLDEQVAWHAGRSAMRPELEDGDPRKEPNVNGFSLGIELVGTDDSGFTDRQLASLYTLLEILVQRYKVKPERVVGHLHIAPGRKIDPDGYDQQFPWAKTRQIAELAYRAVVPSGSVQA